MNSTRVATEFSLVYMTINKPQIVFHPVFNKQIKYAYIAC